MAKPDVVRGQYVNLMLGNGAGPEVFEMVCGLTTRSFTEQVNTSDQFVRDCADPDDVPVRVLNVTGKQWDLSGSGLMNRAQLADLRGAVGVRKNWRMDFDEPADDEVYAGAYTGPAVLTQLAVGATDGELVSVDLTIASDGEWAFVAA